MKQLTLDISEEIFEQLITTAGAAGQTAEQTAAAALRLGLQLSTAAPVPPLSLSAALASLQTATAQDQHVDW